MSGPTSWRDLIRVHPAADQYPMMPENDRDTLAADILANGLRDPISLWYEGGKITPDLEEAWKADIAAGAVPPQLFLLDGRNRLEALWNAAPDPERGRKLVKIALGNGRMSLAPPIAQPQYLDSRDVDPWKFTKSKNVERRHLTPAQKREIIAELKKGRPELSERAIAEMTGTSPATVHRALSVAEGASDEAPENGAAQPQEAPWNPTPSPDNRSAASSAPAPRVTGKDGKSYPAKKNTGRAVQFDKKKAAAPSTPPSQARNKAIAGFSQLLHQQPAATLGDFSRILKGEGGRIREIPREERISFARTCLDALGLGTDDLGDGAAAALEAGGRA